MDERRHELIERYRAGRATLADAVAAHGEEGTGGLTGREVLIHVVARDRREAAALESREPAGTRDVPDALLERLRSLTDEQLHAEYAASEEALVQALTALPDEAFEAGGAGARWAESWADHALDHAAFFGDIGA